jgi:hypothetical protein
MTHARILLAALLALTTQAHAEEALTEQSLLDTFKSHCAKITANPEAAVVAALTGDGTTSGAVTTDQSILQYQQGLTLPGARFATLIFLRNKMPGGTANYCALTVSLTDAVKPLPFPTLADLITANADALLGASAIRSGGDVAQHGEVGQLLRWTAGNAPFSPSISFTQTSNLVQLSSVTATVAPN